MNLTPYEHLDKNELYISIEVVFAYTIAFLLPRKLKREITFLLYMWGFTVSKTLDFSIGGGVFDFYDVCDSSHYDVFDLVSYFLYAPFSYIFIYLYERLKIKGKATAFYIIAWSIVALGFEQLSLIIHMITYKNGYSLFISFPIYLFVQSATIVFYRWINDKSYSLDGKRQSANNSSGDWEFTRLDSLSGNTSDVPHPERHGYR